MALSSLLLKSQVPNSSFEDLTTDGKIKHWGKAFFNVVIIDSAGIAHGDSVVFDQGLYFPTSDAHSGQKALEMRNAFNYTSNQPLAGSVRLMSNDSDFFAYAPMVAIQQRPASFSFYYKFFPVAGDTAFASMVVYNSSGSEIGRSEIGISAPAGNYTQAVKTVTYQSADPAAYIDIDFATAKPGSNAAFGTRLLVDDVGTGTAATAIYSPALKKETAIIFPNPVQNYLMLGPENIFAGQSGTMEISDMNGRLTRQLDFNGSEKDLAIDVSQLTRGMYVLKIISGQKIYTNTFIK